MKLRPVPMYILNRIPLATMVYQYHNTVLEIAGTMDYNLGGYNTLLSRISDYDRQIWGDLYTQRVKVE